MPWPCALRGEMDAIAEIHIYPEHDDAYREECLANLRKKGVELFFNVSISGQALLEGRHQID
jgi:hypothetical protein